MTNILFKPSAFPGILHWQQRLWLTIGQFLKERNKITNQQRLDVSEIEKLDNENKYLYDTRNYYIKGVTFNITGSQQLSVAISKMQGLTNSLRKVALKSLTHSPEYERTLATQIIMLAPFAPRFASELWAGFCSAPYYLIDDQKFIQRDKDVLVQSWPEIDQNYELDLDVFVSFCQNNNQIIVISIFFLSIIIFLNKNLRSMAMK